MEIYNPLYLDLLLKQILTKVIKYQLAGIWLSSIQPVYLSFYLEVLVWHTCGQAVTLQLSCKVGQVEE